MFVSPLRLFLSDSFEFHYRASFRRATGCIHICMYIRKLLSPVSFFYFVSSPSLSSPLLYLMTFCAQHCMVFSCVGGGSLGMCWVWFFPWFLVSEFWSGGLRECDRGVYIIAYFCVETLPVDCTYHCRRFPDCAQLVFYRSHSKAQAGNIYHRSDLV